MKPSQLWFVGVLAAGSFPGEHYAAAATLTSSAFSYGGGAVTLADRPEQSQHVEATWNPKGFGRKQGPHAPGFHISFFGEGAGCTAPISNGPVVALPPEMAAKAEALTGIAVGSNGHGQSWSPITDSGSCQHVENMVPGPAFVVANEAQDGGIGLFTYTGDNGPFVGPHFWHQFAKVGQNGKGTNAFIEGTFIAWTFDWPNNATVLPWSGTGTANSDGPSVIVRTTQSVPVAVSAPTPAHKRPTQVNQHYAITFVNPTCLNSVAARQVCQVRYLFHSMIFRGGEAVEQQPWTKVAHLLLDSAQNGLPVFIGPLKAKGQVTDFGIAGLDLWRSQGDQTQYAPFRDKTFEADISFREFLNGLRIVAGRLLTIDPRKIRNTDLSKVFGSAWGDPRKWLVADINLGQEDHNEDPVHQAYIGGDVRGIQIIAR